MPVCPITYLHLKNRAGLLPILTLAMRYLLTAAIVVNICTGLDWNIVNFLHSSFCGAVVCICAQNSLHNTGAFSLIAQQCLHSIKLFSVSLHCPANEQAWAASYFGRGHS